MHLRFKLGLYFSLRQQLWKKNRIIRKIDYSPGIVEFDEKQIARLCSIMDAVAERPFKISRIAVSVFSISWKN